MRGRKSKDGNKGSVRELNCTAKAGNKTKYKLNKKGIRKCHYPKHGAVSRTEGRTQPASRRSGDSSRFRRPHSGMTLAHTLYSSLQVDLPDFLS